MTTHVESRRRRKRKHVEIALDAIRRAIVVSDADGDEYLMRAAADLVAWQTKVGTRMAQDGSRA